MIMNIYIYMNCIPQLSENFGNISETTNVDSVNIYNKTDLSNSLTYRIFVVE